jgi:ferrous iron transport protein B
MRILLIGNPNVGKSVVFSQLTGVSVIASNYPGTTVEYSKGELKSEGKQYEIVDVPGTYGLDGTCEAEKVAIRMLPTADVVLNVVDATNLERNLNLTLQIKETGIPMIVLLNLWDEAQHKGIEIDVRKLETFLGVPVIPTIAVSGYGLGKCIEYVDTVSRREPFIFSQSDRWQQIGTIIDQVQNLGNRKHTFLEHLQDASVHSVYGLLIAAVVLYTTLKSVLFTGETLITYVSEPIFEGLYEPLLMRLSDLLRGSDILHGILIGTVSGSGIDFEGSMGLLSTGIYVSIGVVLPYIFAFYLILGFLEDLGYLPRLAVLMDSTLHKLGMHGYSVIPMILGAGCNVPGALATRNLSSRREKFIAATLMTVSIPCMAQLALILGLVGRHGMSYLAVVFGALFSVWVTVGLLADRFCGGYTPSLLMEIPSYRIPSYKTQVKKLGMRIRAFLSDGVLHVLGGILIVNLLYTFGVISWIGKFTEPIVTGVFGLPAQAVSALLIGLFRKDVAIVMLEPLNLSVTQTVIASVVLTVYFPCAATFSVLVRELGVTDMLKSCLIMLATALSVGGLLNLFLDRIIPANYLAVCLFVVPLVFLLVSRPRPEDEELEEQVYGYTEDVVER